MSTASDSDTGAGSKVERLAGEGGGGQSRQEAMRTPAEVFAPSKQFLLGWRYTSYSQLGNRSADLLSFIDFQ